MRALPLVVDVGETRALHPFNVSKRIERASGTQSRQRSRYLQRGCSLQKPLASTKRDKCNSRPCRPTRRYDFSPSHCRADAAPYGRLGVPAPQILRLRQNRAWVGACAMQSNVISSQARYSLRHLASGRRRVANLVQDPAQLASNTDVDQHPHPLHQILLIANTCDQSIPTSRGRDAGAEFLRLSARQCKPPITYHLGSPDSRHAISLILVADIDNSWGLCSTHATASCRIFFNLSRLHGPLLGS